MKSFFVSFLCVVLIAVMCEVEGAAKLKKRSAILPQSDTENENYYSDQQFDDNDDDDDDHISKFDELLDDDDDDDDNEGEKQTRRIKRFLFSDKKVTMAFSNTGSTPVQIGCGKTAFFSSKYAIDSQKVKTYKFTPNPVLRNYYCKAWLNGKTMSFKAYTSANKGSDYLPYVINSKGLFLKGELLQIWE